MAKEAVSKQKKISPDRIQVCDSRRIMDEGEGGAATSMKKKRPKVKEEA